MRLVSSLVCALLLTLNGGAAWSQSTGGAVSAKALNAPSQNTPRDYVSKRDTAVATGPKRESANPPQLKEAKTLLARTGASCEFVDAGVVTKQKVKVNGATVQVTSYEVACKEALGWIVTEQNDQVSAFDCAAIDASAAAAGKSWDINNTCRLNANADRRAGFQSLAKAAGLTCKVTEGGFLGQGGAPPISRYQVMCAEKTSYLIDAPTPGSAAKLASLACDKAQGACILSKAFARR